jgi:hypothetical protein
VTVVLQSASGRSVEYRAAADLTEQRASDLAIRWADDRWPDEGWRVLLVL